ncbi:hypothetical protein ACJJTC_002672 [Scirpophaga incertulas]
MDDTQQSRVSDAAAIASRKRRSSILKSQRPPRTPFSELEFHITTPTETTKSRRVSFSKRTGVAEFIAHEATTTWKNFYEEHNKSLESSGNDLLAKPPRQTIGHLGKRLFDQQFEEVEAVDVAIDNNAIRNVNTSFQNIQFAQQLASFEGTGGDTNLLLPQKQFEMSSLTEQQSKVFCEDFAISGMGEMSGKIDINFSAMQSISSKQFSDDLDEIQRDSQRTPISNVVCAGPLTGRNERSEYIEVDLNSTHFSIKNDICDISITDTIDCPKLQDDSKSNYMSVDKKITFPCKDWIEDKENIGAYGTSSLLVNPSTERRHTIVFEKESGNISMTQAIPSVIIPSNKRNTTVYDADLDEMSLTQVNNVSSALLFNPSTERRRTIVFEKESGNMSMTQVIPSVSVASDKRNTTVYDADLGEMSLTQVNNVSSALMFNPSTERRRTIVFEKESGNMSMTQAIPSVVIASDKRNTTVYDADLGEMSLTQVNNVSSALLFNPSTERRRTIMFEKESGNMSMTQVIPSVSVASDKRNTTVYDADLGEMSLTQVNNVSSALMFNPSTERRRTIVFEKESGNMSMTQAIPSVVIASDKRNTTVYDADLGEMSLTQVNNVSSALLFNPSTERRRTIMFEKESGNMSMTQAIPSVNIASDKRNTTVYNTDLSDMSLTQENSLSITEAIPNNIILPGTTSILPSDNLSITEAVPVAKILSKSLIKTVSEVESLNQSKCNKNVDPKDVPAIYKSLMNENSEISCNRKRKLVADAAEFVPNKMDNSVVHPLNKHKIKDDLDEIEKDFQLQTHSSVTLELSNFKNIVDTKSNSDIHIKVNTDKSNMSLTENIKRHKVQPYPSTNEVHMQNPAMSTGRQNSISKNLPENNISVEFNVDIENNLQAIPNVEKNRRRTIVYENDAGNISITQAIPSNIIMSNLLSSGNVTVYDTESCDMSLAQEHNLSMTQAVPDAKIFSIIPNDKSFTTRNDKSGTFNVTENGVMSNNNNGSRKSHSDGLVMSKVCNVKEINLNDDVNNIQRNTENVQTSMLCSLNTKDQVYMCENFEVGSDQTCNKTTNGLLNMSLTGNIESMEEHNKFVNNISLEQTMHLDRTQNTIGNVKSLIVPVTSKMPSLQTSKTEIDNTHKILENSENVLFVSEPADSKITYTDNKDISITQAIPSNIIMCKVSPVKNTSINSTALSEKTNLSIKQAIPNEIVFAKTRNAQSSMLYSSILHVKDDSHFCENLEVSSNQTSNKTTTGPLNISLTRNTESLEGQNKFVNNPSAIEQTIHLDRTQDTTENVNVSSEMPLFRTSKIETETENSHKIQDNSKINMGVGDVISYSDKNELENYKVHPLTSDSIAKINNTDNNIGDISTTQAVLPKIAISKESPRKNTTVNSTVLDSTMSKENNISMTHAISTEIVFVKTSNIPSDGVSKSILGDEMEISMTYAVPVANKHSIIQSEKSFIQPNDTNKSDILNVIENDIMSNNDDVPRNLDSDGFIMSEVCNISKKKNDDVDDINKNLGNAQNMVSFSGHIKNDTNLLGNNEPSNKTMIDLTNMSENIETLKFNHINSNPTELQQVIYLDKIKEGSQHVTHNSHRKSVSDDLVLSNINENILNDDVVYNIQRKPANAQNNDFYGNLEAVLSESSNKTLSVVSNKSLTKKKEAIFSDLILNKTSNNTSDGNLQFVVEDDVQIRSISYTEEISNDDNSFNFKKVDLVDKQVTHKKNIENIDVAEEHFKRVDNVSGIENATLEKKQDIDDLDEIVKDFKLKTNTSLISRVSMRRVTDCDKSMLHDEIHNLSNMTMSVNNISKNQNKSVVDSSSGDHDFKSQCIMSLGEPNELKSIGNINISTREYNMNKKDISMVHDISGTQVGNCSKLRTSKINVSTIVNNITLSKNNLTVNENINETGNNDVLLLNQKTEVRPTVMCKSDNEHISIIEAIPTLRDRPGDVMDEDPNITLSENVDSVKKQNDSIDHRSPIISTENSDTTNSETATRNVPKDCINDSLKMTIFDKSETNNYLKEQDISKYIMNSVREITSISDKTDTHNHVENIVDMSDSNIMQTNANVSAIHMTDANASFSNVLQDKSTIADVQIHCDISDVSMTQDVSDDHQPNIVDMSDSNNMQTNANVSAIHMTDTNASFSNVLQDKSTIADVPIHCDISDVSMTQDVSDAHQPATATTDIVDKASKGKSFTECIAYYKTDFLETESDATIAKDYDSNARPIGTRKLSCSSNATKSSLNTSDSFNTSTSTAPRDNGVKSENNLISIIRKINMLSFMGTWECEWASRSSDLWTFRLLHGRLKLTVRLTTNSSNGELQPADTQVLATDVSSADKKGVVGNLCVRFAAEAVRYVAARGCRAARDVPLLLRRGAAVARLAARWGRAMYDAHVHLAYTLTPDGRLALKVANFSLRSVWEVTMRLEMVRARAAPRAGGRAARLGARAARAVVSGRCAPRAGPRGRERARAAPRAGGRAARLGARAARAVVSGRCAPRAGPRGRERARAAPRAGGRAARLGARAARAVVSGRCAPRAGPRGRERARAAPRAGGRAARLGARAARAVVSGRCAPRAGPRGRERARAAPRAGGRAARLGARAARAVVSGRCAPRAGPRGRERARAAPRAGGRAARLGARAARAVVSGRCAPRAGPRGGERARAAPRAGGRAARLGARAARAVVSGRCAPRAGPRGRERARAAPRAGGRAARLGARAARAVVSGRCAPRAGPRGGERARAAPRAGGRAARLGARAARAVVSGRCAPRAGPRGRGEQSCAARLGARAAQCAAVRSLGILDTTTRVARATPRGDRLRILVNFRVLDCSVARAAPRGDRLRILVNFRVFDCSVARAAPRGDRLRILVNFRVLDCSVARAASRGDRLRILVNFRVLDCSVARTAPRGDRLRILVNFRVFDCSVARAASRGDRLRILVNFRVLDCSVARAAPRGDRLRILVNFRVFDCSVARAAPRRDRLRILVNFPSCSTSCAERGQAENPRKLSSIGLRCSTSCAERGQAKNPRKLSSIGLQCSTSCAERGQPENPRKLSSVRLQCSTSCAERGQAENPRKDNQWRIFKYLKNKTRDREFLGL